MHGGVINGNGCRKLIQKADYLQSNGPLIVQPFTDTFRALEQVVMSCFGCDLDPRYEEHIDQFKSKYFDLVALKYANITPKIHAILHHVPEFCTKYGALGIHSEQASESVHADFKKTFSKYKIGIKHSDYNKYLLRAVCEYNCIHL